MKWILIYGNGFSSAWVDSSIQRFLDPSLSGRMNEIRIGSVMKRLLREQRKTLKEVSRETKIPYSTLHTWIENRQPKDILKAQTLATYLGLTLHELLFDRVDSKEKPHDSAQAEKILRDELFKGVFEIIVRRIE